MSKVFTNKEIAFGIKELLSCIEEDSGKGSVLHSACFLSVLLGVGEDEEIINGEFEPNSEIDQYIDRVSDLIEAKKFKQLKQDSKQTLLSNEKYEILSYLGSYFDNI